MGQGWRKGNDHHLKRGFLQSENYETLQGLRPHARGAPVAIVPHYLYSKRERIYVQIIPGQAGTWGVIISYKIGFLQSRFFYEIYR